MATICKMLPGQSIVEDLNCVIKEREFNLKYLLLFISIFVTHPSENSSLIKDAVDSWLKEAVDNKNKTLLGTVLLVSRQCCAEGIKHFANYPSWFTSLQLKSSEAFSFFFQLLSDIVPYEPAIYLKIHVNKVPSAPSNCQSMLVDYLQLAKSRLADLNESTNYIGLFNDYHDSDVEGQEADINRVITYYMENKEIAKPVIEASVFRRQYFEKVFVPRLLSVSEREDSNRAQVIRKLHSLGKISTAHYNEWNTKSC